MQRSLNSKIVFSQQIAILLMSICGLMLSCRGQLVKDENGAHKYTNELISSTSPYLLQHAHNPVNWYPWGDKALQKAEKEDKLIVISIGYAACHWCHVMEHESFEDEGIAQTMNKHYVSIKVDREERPDIDRIYMNASYMINQRGGWPLNVIALPDGRPIFAGTYFPKERWMQVVDHFANMYKNEKGKLVNIADQITAGIQQIDGELFQQKDTVINEEVLESASLTLTNEIDFKKGGFKGAPKFPSPTTYQFLLRQYYFSEDAKTWEAVKVTLDNMAKGGIYDQVGGGFARYSTDADWKVPHFEKMLYDNAQLVSLYSEAYKVNSDPLYKQIVEETLEFVKREMTDDAGGFYSSLDADSEEEEGKFYVWTEEEIDSVLGEDADLIKTFFSISEKGNWEHKNILIINEDLPSFAKATKLNEVVIREKIALAKEKLLVERSKRTRPGLDDKILTSWNALMLKGYVDAYRALGNEDYLEIALKNAQFLKTNMIKDGYRLERNFKNGTSSINGFLDDYALLIEAFIHLYQVTFDENWLFDAEKLMGYVLSNFNNEDGEMFYYTSSADAPLITRSKEVDDNAIPSSNSTIAKDLFLLGTYLYKEDFINKSRAMLSSVTDRVSTYTSGYVNWAMVYQLHQYNMYEVAIVGEDWKDKKTIFDRRFLPHTLLLGGKTEGQLDLLKNKAIPGRTMIYVCQNKSCRLPQVDPDLAFNMIKRPSAD